MSLKTFLWSCLPHVRWVHDLAWPFFYPRDWWAQRKRDKAMWARFHAFMHSKGWRKVRGKWVKEP